MTELTPEERDRIYQEEKARHEARQAIELKGRREVAARQKRRSQRTVLGFLVGVVVVAGFCMILAKTSPSPPPRSPAKVLEDVTRAEEGLAILRQGGIVITTNAGEKKVYVNNRMWRGFPENTKADSAWAMAVAMGIPSVEIYDVTTGRKVGSYARGGQYENLDLGR